VAPFLALHSILPDFMVVVAVFYMLTARDHDAALAGWVIGLVMDLMSLSYPQQRYANVGLHALSLGLIALMAVKARGAVVRESVWSQIVFAFVAKFLLALVAGAHLHFVTDFHGGFADAAARGLYEAIYCAAIAPYGCWILQRLRGLLGVGFSQRWSVG
jgi:rod shape-determining protein MreD